MIQGPRGARARGDQAGAEDRDPGGRQGGGRHNVILYNATYYIIL